MRAIETRRCLLEVDPLDIQLKLGNELGKLLCRRCHKSCFGTSDPEVDDTGIVLFFQGDESTDGVVEVAEACKSRNREIKRVITATVVTGSVANDYREEMPWGEVGLAYSRPLKEPTTGIYFVDPTYLTDPTSDT